jgi:hypothetical protein
MWTCRWVSIFARKCIITQGLGSSVSIVSDYRLVDQTTGIIAPEQAKGFSSSLCVQTSSEVHRASYPMGLRGKEQLRHDTDHSPPSSAEIKKT